MQKGCIRLLFYCKSLKYQSIKISKTYLSGKHSKDYNSIQPIMKATARQLTTYGNLALVQLEIRPETTFFFKPGEPEIRNGGLVISETGSVGKLTAENNTDSFLLLTDADVLIGAKQNRIINKSVLLSPFSKTVLGVSCIERGRWSFTTKYFSSPSVVADSDLRKEKAQSIAFSLSGPEAQELDTQSRVWFHINEKLKEEKFVSETDNYYDLLSYRHNSIKPGFPSCKPENGCNGLAVILDHKVLNVDLFGKEDIYKFYFPKLRDSAFRQAIIIEEKNSIDVHEAYFKVLDLLDNYEKEKGIQDMDHCGAGSFHIVENNKLLGFNLTIENQLIHNVVFSK